MTSDDLDQLVGFLADPQRGDGGPVEVELCPLGAEAVGGALAWRRHRLGGEPPGLTIEVVAGERLAVWSQVLLDGEPVGASSVLVAAGAGCGLAVVTADPGSSSGRNARRAGFSLAYTNVRVRLAPVPCT